MDEDLDENWEEVIVLNTKVNVAGGKERMELAIFSKRMSLEDQLGHESCLAWRAARLASTSSRPCGLLCSAS